MDDGQERQSEMNLHERNRLRNREHIGNVALEVFLKNGFEETRVEVVAEAAGVSRRTFFRYFPTKEAAFFAPSEARMAIFKDLLAKDRDILSGYDRVRRACIAMADHFTKERDEMLIFHQCIAASRHLIAYELQLDVVWEGLFYETLLEGSEDPQKMLASRIWASALLGAIRSATREWFKTGATTDLVQTAHEAFDLLEAFPFQKTLNTT